IAPVYRDRPVAPDPLERRANGSFRPGVGSSSWPAHRRTYLSVSGNLAAAVAVEKEDHQDGRSDRRARKGTRNTRTKSTRTESWGDCYAGCFFPVREEAVAFLHSA